MSKDNFYALILGCSSGFGKATALELAKKGYNILGVHLDMGENRKKAEDLEEELKALNVKVKFYNVNAADDDKRREIIEYMRLEHAKVKVFMHSLAFGSLKPYLAITQSDTINRKSLQMTMDVMAHSLVYWTQDIFNNQLFADGARVFAMTSNASTKVMPYYGAISAAKAALESHTRQIALELAPYNITANSISAGVTDTPAAQKIPGIEKYLELSSNASPFKRNTETVDIARFIAMISEENSYWMTGNVIRVDGGENIVF